MIRFDIQDNIHLQQWISDPAVYLDHWALRTISEDKKIKDKFTNALCKKQGTLVLSLINLLEFTKLTDSKQANVAESIVNDIIPNIFFIEIDPFQVINKEDQLIKGSAFIAPHSATEFLEILINRNSKSLNLFSAEGLFSTFQRSYLEKNLTELSDIIINRTINMRDKINNDLEFAQNVRHGASGPNIQRGTRYILLELVCSLLIDQNLKLTPNHAIDLLHSIVPISYCDFVLLDKHWKTQVDILRNRFKKNKISVPLAYVYSKRDNGINKFLNHLIRY